MSLKSIKNKIRGIDKTHTVTKAMEAVSAVKMRKSQDRALSGRAYAYAALSILRRVGLSREAGRHPFLREREVSKRAVIVITSDRGLAGNVNTAVLRAVEKHLEVRGVKKERTGIITIGKKGHDYFEKRGYTIIERVETTEDTLSRGSFEVLMARIGKLFLDEAYDAVDIAYNQFRSTFEQEPVVRQLLPLSVADVEAVIRGIVPEKGKYASLVHDFPEEPVVYTIEPNAEEALNVLLPHLMNTELYHSILEAKASEHSARMVAMKNASDKARDLSKELTLSLNKMRQAQITREVSEIVGGIEAMS